MNAHQRKIDKRKKAVERQTKGKMHTQYDKDLFLSFLALLKMHISCTLPDNMAWSAVNAYRSRLVSTSGQSYTWVMRKVAADMYGDGKR